MTSSIIGSTMVIDGEVSGDEDVTIQGTVKGRVRARRAVVVEAGAVVEAEITARSLEISGHLIGNVIAEIVSRKGIGRKKSLDQRQKAWREAVGETLAAVTRCGEIRRRRLEVIAANSIVMQELSFMKQQILSELRARDPDLRIDDLRFRVGSIPDGE